ncbi:portal protein [Pseudomonas phage PspYZU05]|uniref:Portal protein n=1 Tax=Pseudomonas phage PspYZU05 TaxID=1983556 RepID=A0A2U7N8C1_9CAUD|nr:portal protein [Pseudomonas phage PspYZU05]ASD52083.1 portal vertex protein [Pseudomonas phage PspYZU05]
MVNNILNMFMPWHLRDQKEYQKDINDGIESITSPKLDDGATEIESNFQMGALSGFFQQMYGSHDTKLKNTAELINTYRNLLNNYEVDNAVQEIVSDAIVYERGHDTVSLDLDQTEFSESIKEKILDEFKTVESLLDFQRKGSDHFKRWYVDSRIFFHKIINPKKLSDGVLEVRRLDPKSIEFVREIKTDMEKGIKVVKGIKEYFIYDTGRESYQIGSQVYTPGTRVQIPKSAMVYSHSGLVDCEGKNIIGYLHRAVKPANQLKLLEDAMVIYRITRAPDRRVFYIDTGNMNSRKSNEHMQHVMNTFKNRVVYDATTGKIKNQQHNMSMTEDYWLQRRDGKAVTSVETLPGATGMNEMDDVRWFRSALYMALRIPLSRIPSDSQGIQFDAGNTISRDELQFSKFIRELQNKFEEIFMDLLRTNLVLKKIITEDEWVQERNNILIVFHKDSYFTEIRDAEIQERRINLFNTAESVIGKYISRRTAMKDFLLMSDEDIDAEIKQIELENKMSIYKDPEEEF